MFQNESVVDRLWEGRPSTARNKNFWNTVAILAWEDRRITIHELAYCLNILVGSAFPILHDDLQLWSVWCRWVPYFLTPEQMAHHIAACNELHMWFKGEWEAEFRDVITMDEFRAAITLTENKKYIKYNSSRIVLDHIFLYADNGSMSEHARLWNITKHKKVRRGMRILHCTSLIDKPPRIFHYDPESKHLSSQWKTSTSPVPK